MAVLPSVAAAAEPGSRKALEQAAEANTQLAVAYMRENNLKAAREKIDKALQQNARTPNTQMTAGFIYDKLADQKKAAYHFEQAIKLAGSDYPEVVANSAVFFCMNGDPKRGEAYLLQAAASPLNNRSDLAYTNAGRCARWAEAAWRDWWSSPTTGAGTRRAASTWCAVSWTGTQPCG